MSQSIAQPNLPEVTPPRSPHAQHTWKIALWLCIGISVLIAFFHISYFTSAGGLWRDEATSFNVATSPTFGEMWRLRDFDSFPILWPTILRGWIKSGMGATDQRIRVLGLIAGFGLLAAIWLRAQLVDRGLPLFGLALLALNPYIIRFGDSIRAYGLGMIALTLMFIAIWRLVRQVTWKNYLFAAVASLIACQLLYYNTLVLFSLAVAGAIVCVRRRRIRDAIIVLAVGIPSAAAMIFYFDIASRLDSWQPLLKIAFTFEVLAAKLRGVLGAQGDGVMVIWIVLLLATLVAGVIAQNHRRTPNLSDEERDRALFSLVTILVLFPLYYFFLRSLSYITESWYYFAVLAVAAFCIESTLSMFYRHVNLHRVALAVVATTLLSSILLDYRLVAMRMTNADLIARALEANASVDDLIIVRPWYMGVSFDRYYHGATPWMTIPDFPSHRYHRYDIVKKFMGDPDNALDPLYEAISKTLASGHRVWVCGPLPPVKDRTMLIHLTPAPDPSAGWSEPIYNMAWSQRISYFLQNAVTNIDLHVEGENVSQYENIILFAYYGLNPSAGEVLQELHQPN